MPRREKRSIFSPLKKAHLSSTTVAKAIESPPMSFFLRVPSLGQRTIGFEPMATGSIRPALFL